MVEVWKKIGGFPLYEVSNMGRVRSWNSFGRASGTKVKNPKILCLALCSDGRVRVRLGRKGGFRISTLVCEAFHGEKPDGMECCHNNGNPTDNRAINLRWDTRSGNHADKLIHGTHSRGEKHGESKLTKKDVLKIKKLASSGLSQRKIAKTFSISQQHVSRLVNGKRWEWLEV